MAEKKKFINIDAPLLHTTIEALGTPVSLHNKTIKLDLSRKLRGKGLTATFQIINIDNKLIAVPKRYELSTSYVRRIMRKRADYVEDSFKTQTQDNITVSIKPLLITRKRVSRVVRKRLREVSKESILEYVKTKTYMELSESILNSDLQKIMLPKLKKIYPLAFCDLRVFETTEISKLDLETLNTAIEEEEKVEFKDEKDIQDEEDKDIQDEEDIQGDEEEIKEENIQDEEKETKELNEEDKDANKEQA